jgi:hypothetical protein
MENMGKDQILDVFSDVAKSVNPQFKKEDVEPVLSRAFNNFQSEMNQPFEEFEITAPSDMKAHIFNILCKHFTNCLMNDKIFMQDDESVSEINKRIQNLMD